MASKGMVFVVLQGDYVDQGESIIAVCASRASARAVVKDLEKFGPNLGEQGELRIDAWGIQP